MQLIPRYLVNNRTTIIANEAGFITEYRPVYQRQITVYSGIDNQLQFRVLNADQKPVNINSYTPKFVAFDENNKMVIEHDGSINSLDDSSATRGLFTITITENDLLNVKSQYLKYNVYLVDASNSKVLTYTSSYFDGCGTIFVDPCQMPGPVDSYSVEAFTKYNFNTDLWLSETISAEPAINGNEALHTAVVYTNGYAGDIVIQATLENQVDEGTKWADVDTLTLTGAETEPTPINFTGVFNHLRFKADANPETISKILVRN